MVSTDKEKKYFQAVEELDELIGMLEPGTLTVIEGRPGAGKSTLALSLAYRNIVEKGAKTLYLSFGETPDKLFKRCENLGLDMKRYSERGLFKVVWLPMMKGKELVDFITKTVFEEGVGRGYDIIIIDSITPILKLLGSYEAQRSWLQTVIYHFFSRAQGVLIMIADILQRDSPELTLLEYIADIVLELSYAIGPIGTYERKITVKKHRFYPVEIASYPFDISFRGIKVLGHVSRKRQERFLKRRRSIDVDCKILARIFGDRIEPGTQIFVLNRNPLKVNAANLAHYVGERMLDKLRGGASIVAFTYSQYSLIDMIKSRTSIFDKEFERLVKERMRIEYLDPTTTAPSMIVSREVETVEKTNADILFLWHLERVIEAVGYEAAKPFIMYSIQYYKKIGLTVVRYYELINPMNIPWAYLVWNDIILELDVDNVGRTFIRGRQMGRPAIEIYDDEIAACLERGVRRRRS